ncbi:MAG: MraY family glycosyltransferase [Pseudomonadota bacterium]
MRVIDYPDVTGGRKRHSRPTPLMGGIAVLVSLFLTAPIAFWASDPVPAQIGDVAAMALLIAVFALIGFIDDREELSPKIRLVIMLLCAAFAVNNQPSLTVQFLHFEFSDRVFILGGWGAVFTVLSLVGLANAVNMADGKNGLVIGMAIIWNAVLLFYGAPILLPVLMVSLACLIVVFIYNLRGKLFLGDTGSFGLACFFGTVAIYSYTHNFTRLPADMIVLFFMVPVVDCLRLMVARVLRGSSPFSAGRDHLHHHIAARMGWTKGLFVYQSIIAVPIALHLLSSDFALLAVLLQFTGYCFTLSLCAYAGRGAASDAAA